MTKEENLSRFFGKEMTDDECRGLAEALGWAVDEVRGMQRLGQMLFPDPDVVEEEHKRAVKYLDSLHPVYPTGHSVQEDFRYSHAFTDGTEKYDQMYVELGGEDFYCYIGTREVLLALSILIRTNELQELPAEIAKHYAELCNVPVEWFCKSYNEEDDWDFLN